MRGRRDASHRGVGDGRCRLIAQREACALPRAGALERVWSAVYLGCPERGLCGVGQCQCALPCGREGAGQRLIASGPAGCIVPRKPKSALFRAGALARLRGSGLTRKLRVRVARCDSTNAPFWGEEERGLDAGRLKPN